MTDKADKAGVAAYQGREFCTTAQAVVTIHGARLQSLIGLRLQQVFAAWDCGAASWFEDEPVILVFGERGERCLELCHTQFSMLWLSENSIDLRSRPTFCAEWIGFDLEWRAYDVAAADAVVSKELTGIGILEGCMRTWPAGREGPVHTSWILDGVLFSFGSEVLQVFNALDKNGVSNEQRLHADLRVVSL